MKGYLLDINHLSHALRVVSPLRDRLRQLHRQGFRLITCWPVLCKLQEGIVFTADPGHYGRTLKAMMKEMRIWPMDWNIVEQYSACAAEGLRIKARTAITATWQRRLSISNSLKKLRAQKNGAPTSHEAAGHR